MSVDHVLRGYAQGMPHGNAATVAGWFRVLEIQASRSLGRALALTSPITNGDMTYSDGKHCVARPRYVGFLMQAACVVGAIIFGLFRCRSKPDSWWVIGFCCDLQVIGGRVRELIPATQFSWYRVIGVAVLLIGMSICGASDMAKAPADLTHVARPRQAGAV